MRTGVPISLAMLTIVALIAAGSVQALGPAPVSSRASGGEDGSPRKVWPRLPYPDRRAISRAQAFAASGGDVSFALIDRSVGLRGYDVDAQYSSASVSKVLLLTAELRRLERGNHELDGATKGLLTRMIAYSDNRAADAIYARVGDAGLEEVARRAGMQSFEPVPGFWGGDKITAVDMARFFYRLEANLPARHGSWAKGLLARVAAVERWGIPAAVGRGWTVWLKGGWRPPEEEQTSGPVTHQAGLLVHRNGERLALAVLTDEAPAAGGIEAIESLAELLLRKTPPHRGGWVAP